MNKILNSPELIDRILDWNRKGYAGPFMLELRPTNRCNLNCPTCVLRGRAQPTNYELSPGEYRKIIDEAADLGVRYVQIVGGGEPMIRGKETLAIMEMIKSKQMFGFMVTNGTLFDENSINNIVKLGWDSILFSLDGTTPKTNDYLRSSKGAFRKTTSAISNSSRFKKKYKTSRPLISIGPVLSRKNYTQLPEFVQLAHKLGADNVTFQPVKLPKTDAIKEFIFCREEYPKLKRLLSEAKELAAKLDIQTNCAEIDRTIIENSCKPTMAIQRYADSYSDDALLSVPCFSPWFYIGITPDGYVDVCSIASSSYIESIQRNNLAEIWNGKVFNRFRERLSGHLLLDKCRDCCGTIVIETRRIRERLAERRQEIR